MLLQEMSFQQNYATVFQCTSPFQHRKDTKNANRKSSAAKKGFVTSSIQMLPSNYSNTDLGSKDLIANKLAIIVENPGAKQL